MPRLFLVSPTCSLMSAAPLFCRMSSLQASPRTTMSYSARRQTGPVFFIRFGSLAQRTKVWKNSGSLWTVHTRRRQVLSSPRCKQSCQWESHGLACKGCPWRGSLDLTLRVYSPQKFRPNSGDPKKPFSSSCHLTRLVFIVLSLSLSLSLRRYLFCFLSASL